MAQSLFSLLFALVLPLLSFLVLPGQAAEDILLFDPVSSSGPETLLICIPGMLVPASEYVPICKGVQAGIPFKTWLAVMSFKENTVTPFAVRKGLDMATDRVKQAGFTNVTASDIFVWAHSAGGAFATDVVAERRYAGFMLFGSYLSGAPLETYPVPVLMVGGELDGLCQITKIAEFYRVCRDLLFNGNEEEAVRRKAVVVLPGINHAQMCNNYIDGVIEAKDFEPEIPLQLAEEEMAAVSAAFVQLQRQAGKPQDAYSLLLQHIQATNSLVGAFLLAQDQDQGEWCVRSQKIIANFNNESILEVTNVLEPNLDAFAESKPGLTVKEGVAFTTTHSFLNFTPSFPIASAINASSRGSTGKVVIFSEGQAAVEACCKCKSQEAIADALKTTDHGPDGKCRDINEAIFAEALKNVAESSRARYLAKGRQLAFLDDISHPRGDIWLNSHFIFDTSKDPVQVIGSLLTSANIPTPFGGATYCKGLSAAKAVSWILHDSLPRGLQPKS